jgi:nucleoside-diphosphate-sugar epimerase
MKYVVAGATSGTGLAVLKRLVDKVGTDITCLVRSNTYIPALEALGVKHHRCDITEPASYTHILNPSVTYLDMTHPKHYHKSLAAIASSGVERAYFVTTTGIFSKYNQLSEIYQVNEAKIQSSGLIYTILRPSMIYGHTRDRNMSRLIKYLNTFPAFPLFGTGRNLMQPVFVDDLADGIVSAIGSHTENQIYNLAGPEPLAYCDLVATILKALERRVIILNIPFELAAFAAGVGQKIPGFPVTKEQVLRLQEDKAFDISKAASELRYAPRSFAEGIKEEIVQMRKEGML